LWICVILAVLIGACVLLRVPDLSKRVIVSSDFCYFAFKYDFDVELRLSPRWVGGNIRSTDATKTCHNLNAFFETNNQRVINNTSLDSL
jgi:hypothetical protein